MKRITRPAKFKRVFAIVSMSIFLLGCGGGNDSTPSFGDRGGGDDFSAENTEPDVYDLEEKLERIKNMASSAESTLSSAQGGDYDDLENAIQECLDELSNIESEADY